MFAGSILAEPGKSICRTSWRAGWSTPKTENAERSRTIWA
jgi:hypothetical protein